MVAQYRTIKVAMLSRVRTITVQRVMHKLFPWRKKVQSVQLVLVELVTWEALISEQCFLPQEICRTTTVSATQHSAAQAGSSY